MAPDANAGKGRDTRSLLPPLIHGRVRLLILSVLLRTGLPISFTDLRKTLDLTDGTLSVHLAKLEEGHLVKIRKTFIGKKPQTVIRITGRGKKLFEEYVQDLKEIIPGLD